MKAVSMAEIKALYNPGEGRHWFDRSTMRFFRIKLPRQGYQADDGTIYFVTSEQFIGSNGAHPRRYSVRRMSSQTRDISTVGEFNKITTSTEATAAAKMLAMRPCLETA